MNGWFRDPVTVLVDGFLLTVFPKERVRAVSGADPFL